MRNKRLAAVIGIAVTLALLAWVVRDVSFSEVWHAARTAHPGWLLVAIALATSTFVLRLFRWRLLLRTDADATVPAGPMWHAIAIGFMANNILPLRAGEVLRALTINRLAPVKVSSAFSSLVVERLFDAVVILGLLFVGLLGAGLPTDAEIAGLRMSTLATRTGILVGIAFAGCLVALFLPGPTDAVVRAIAPARIAARLLSVLEGIRGGMAALSSPARIAGIMAWSLAIWLVNGLSFYAGFLAFDIPVGMGGALLQQSLLVLGIAVPSTPGFFGPFEAAIKAVLTLFGVESNRAVSYALTYHITTFFPITVLGLVSLARTPVSLRSMQEVSREESGDGPRA